MQYCVGFCHASTWISHGYTHVPSPLSLPPPPTSSRPSRMLLSLSQSHTAKSHLLSILHVVVFMLPCHSTIFLILTFSFFFILAGIVKILFIFSFQVLYQICVLQIFSPSLLVILHFLEGVF